MKRDTTFPDDPFAREEKLLLEAELELMYGKEEDFEAVIYD